MCVLNLPPAMTGSRVCRAVAEGGRLDDVSAWSLRELEIVRFSV